MLLAINAQVSQADIAFESHTHVRWNMQLELARSDFYVARHNSG
jgi:hypothetical protein